MSAGATEWVTPDSPPMVNMDTTPEAKSIGVLKRMRPPHMVASQFRIFTPVGTAMNIVDTEKKEFGFVDEYLGHEIESLEAAYNEKVQMEF